MPCNYCVHSSFDNLILKSISSEIFLYFLVQSVCISAPLSFLFVFLLTYCQHIFFRDVPGVRWAEERNQCHVIIVFIVLFITCSFIFFKSFSAGTFLYFCRQSVCISLAVMYQVPGGRRNVIGVIYRRAQISNCLLLSRSTKY